MLTKPGLISKNQKEQILKATDIVQLISGYVPLRASGKNFIGLCPFHQEKTPSFTVSPSHQNYKCYGCGEYGDAIRFLMAIENFRFVEAVQFLADRCGITLQADTAAEKTIERPSALNRCMLESNAFFRDNLQKGDQHSAIKAYLRQREIDDASIERFQLGYVGPGWTNLHDHLNSKSIAAVVQENAGLIKANDRGGYYDRLRNRLVFPIHDQKGCLIGFAGRVIGDDKPKYLNPPETVLYKKQAVLYGVFEARDTIRRSRRAIVVEGYLDVIRLHSLSWTETVATCGTALTDGHVIALKRLGAEETILLFDGDTAGIAAAERSVRVFLKNDMDSRVVVLPDGQDPDDYGKKHSREQVQGLFDAARRDVEFIIDQSRRRMGGIGIERQRRVVESVLEISLDIKSGIKRDLFRASVASAFQLNPQSLRQPAIRRVPEPPESTSQSSTGYQAPFVFDQQSLPEVRFLQYLLTHNEAIGFVRHQLSEQDFIRQELACLYRRLLQLSDQEFGTLKPKDFPDLFVEYGDLITYLLHYRSEYTGPTVSRKRLFGSDRDSEMARLQQDNENLVNAFSEPALFRLIQRVKQQKAAFVKQSLYHLESERAREHVRRLADYRKRTKSLEPDQLTHPKASANKPGNS
jgi:DNA primase